MNLAYQCFRLALASNNDHAEAYNNLGVLEMRKGHIEQVGHFCTYRAVSFAREEEGFEPFTMLVKSVLCIFVGQKSYQKRAIQTQLLFEPGILVAIYFVMKCLLFCFNCKIGTSGEFI